MKSLVFINVTVLLFFCLQQLLVVLQCCYGTDFLCDLRKKIKMILKVAADNPS